MIVKSLSNIKYCNVALQIDGFFVEYRAGNGERQSDTLFMERYLGWTGLLIETDPLNVDSLQRVGRKAWIAPTCLSLNTSAYLVTANNIYFIKTRQRLCKT